MRPEGRGDGNERAGGNPDAEAAYDVGDARASSRTSEYRKTHSRAETGDASANDASRSDSEGARRPKIWGGRPWTAA